MDATSISWDDLRLFLAVGRGGTLAAAAASADVHSSTVHRRLARLEERLDATLFERGPRGYALTACGADLLEHAAAIEREVLALGRRISGRDQRLTGAVRLATVDDIALFVLAPIVEQFRSLHSQVTIEIDVLSERRDLARRQADIAIRPGGRPTEEDVVGRKVCGVGVAFYASRSYLRRHGVFETPEHLVDHAIVRADHKRAHLAMEKLVDRHADPARIAMRSNSMLARLAAVREGIGVGVLPCFAADREPKLVRIGTVRPELSAELWIDVHVDLRKNARVRAFVEFAHAELLKMRDQFEGTS